MNKELYKIEDMKGVIENFKVEDEGVSFTINGARVAFETHHDQDCCEQVYGDFSVMKYHQAELEGKSLRELVVKGVDDIGFLLCFNLGDWGDKWVKVFIPCYNYQNGYYSSDLQLNITAGELKVEIDVSDLVEDHEG